MQDNAHVELMNIFLLIVWCGNYTMTLSHILHLFMLFFFLCLQAYNYCSLNEMLKTWWIKYYKRNEWINKYHVTLGMYFIRKGVIIKVLIIISKYIMCSIDFKVAYLVYII